MSKLKEMSADECREIRAGAQRMEMDDLTSQAGGFVPIIIAVVGAISAAVAGAAASTALAGGVGGSVVARNTGGNSASSPKQ